MAVTAEMRNFPAELWITSEARNSCSQIAAHMLSSVISPAKVWDKSEAQGSVSG
jgi:hypothetical protein